MYDILFHHFCFASVQKMECPVNPRRLRSLWFYANIKSSIILFIRLALCEVEIIFYLYIWLVYCVFVLFLSVCTLFSLCPLLQYNDLVGFVRFSVGYCWGKKHAALWHSRREDCVRLRLSVHVSEVVDTKSVEEYTPQLPRPQTL